MSRVIIGKYEGDETVASNDAAKKIADALEVSLNYLTGDTKTPAYDKKTLHRHEDLQQLEEPKKQPLFDLMDTYIRDAKARKAYAS